MFPGPSLSFAASHRSSEEQEPLKSSGSFPDFTFVLQVSAPASLPAAPWGPAFSLDPGDAWTHPGLLCRCITAEPLKRVLDPSGEIPSNACPLSTQRPAPLSSSPASPPLLPSFLSSLLPSFPSFLHLRSLLCPSAPPRSSSESKLHAPCLLSAQPAVPRPPTEAGMPEQALALWLLGLPLLQPGPTPVLSLSQIWI